jgi:hypothetical protein
MEIPLEKLQASEIIRKAVSELNKVVDDAESLGLKVNFLSRNPHSLNPDVEPLKVVIQEIITY